MKYRNIEVVNKQMQNKMDRDVIKIEVKTRSKNTPKTVDSLLPVVIRDISKGRNCNSYIAYLDEASCFHHIYSYIHKISEAIKLEFNCRTAISYDNIKFSRLSGGDDMLINYVECHIELLHIDEKDYSLLSSYRNYCRKMQIY